MAVSKYTEKSFFELTGNQISNISQLKLFNILLDNDRQTKFMNIFRVARVNTDVTEDVLFFDTYEVPDGNFWDNISHEIYNIPQLWWILGLMNNTVNPFEELDAGTNISVLKAEYVYNLTKDLENLSEL
jgi:hypothetical protein